MKSICSDTNKFTCDAVESNECGITNVFLLIACFDFMK